MSKSITSNVCIDIGGTYTRIGLISNQQIKEVIKFETLKDPKQNFTKIKQLIEGYRHLPIGISTAGPISTQLVYGQLPNLPQWEGFDLAAEFTDYRLYVVENDANCSAVCEHHPDYKSTLFLTISTGIGGGFVYSNQLFKGISSNELEVHNYKLENGQSIEAVSSGTGIYNQAIAQGLAVSNTKQVFEMAATSAIAKQIIDQALAHLCTMICNLIAILNPGQLVLGGSVVTNNHQFFEQLQTKIAATIVVECPIKVAVEPEYSPLLGVNKLLEEQL